MEEVVHLQLTFSIEECVGELLGTNLEVRIVFCPVVATIDQIYYGIRITHGSPREHV